MTWIYLVVNGIVQILLLHCFNQMILKRHTILCLLLNLRKIDLLGVAASLLATTQPINHILRKDPFANALDVHELESGDKMASPLKNGLFICGMLIIGAQIGEQVNSSSNSHSSRSIIFGIFMPILNPLQNWGGHYFPVLIGLAICYFLCNCLDNKYAGYSGKTVVNFTLSKTKLVLQSSTLGCLSRVSMMKRL
jgi:hypothetical protein